MAGSKSRKAADREPPLASAPPAPAEVRWDIAPWLPWMFLGYVMLIPLGDLLLNWGSPLWVSGEVKWDRSRFAVASALTLTGFPSSTSFAHAPLLLLALTLIGQIFVLTLGGLAAIRILKLPHSDRQVLTAAVAASLVIPALGALPLIEGGHGPLEAMVLSASAFGNSGAYARSLPGLVSWQIHAVLLPLAVLGALGLPVLMEAPRFLARRGGLTFHSQVALLSTAVAYLAGLFLLLLVNWFSLETTPEVEQLPRFFASASVQAINTRTAGFPLELAQELPRAVAWLLVPLMIIGGNPAGTAGGVKTTTFVELFRGTRRALLGLAPGRAFGIAAAWLGVYCLAAGTAFLALLATAPQVPAERLLFETISALSNVGLAYDQILLTTPASDVLVLAMLFGRLAPLWFLWWMVSSTADADLLVA